MDSATIKWWIKRAGDLEKEVGEWRDTAKRLANPYHDQNCEYGVQCSYCTALEKARQ